METLKIVNKTRAKPPYNAKAYLQKLYTSPMKLMQR